MSVSRAVEPVGVNPALNPCKNRKVKKNSTENENGYTQEIKMENKIPK